MAELSGSLEGIGLVALVRFLTSVAEAGRLVIRDGDMTGVLDINDRSVVGATFDHERGMPALEAIALALGRGRFDFRDATQPVERNLRLASEQVGERLEQLAREQATLSAAIPSLLAVPYLILEEGNDNREVALDRDTLRLMIRLDGQRTVAELARERGLLRTLRQLAQLVQMGLARVEAGEAVPVGPKAQAPLYEQVAQRQAMEADDTDEISAPVTSGPSGRPRPGTPEPSWSRWRRPPANPDRS